MISKKHRNERWLLDKFSDLEPRLNTFFGKTIVVNFPDTSELEIPHDLRTVPIDVLIGSVSVNAVIHRGSTEWTRTAVYLQATAACSARIFLVVQ